MWNKIKWRNTVYGVIKMDNEYDLCLDMGAPKHHERNQIQKIELNALHTHARDQPNQNPHRRPVGRPLRLIENMFL